MQPTILGIVNCTPDSFSDGGSYENAEAAISKARELFQNGADIVDVGGDASGPGSVCVGSHTEWKRIETVVSALAPKCSISVDTHFARTARESLAAGASIINDVSAGMDRAMFGTIADSDARYVCMFSCWEAPHIFGAGLADDVIGTIKAFFEVKINAMLKAGIRPSQIILDPGMGAFLSADAAVSWAVLRGVAELSALGFPLLLGISRKRFLREVPNVDSYSSDELSALVARAVWMNSPERCNLFFRVHAPAVHRQVFSRSEGESQPFLEYLCCEPN